MERGGGFQKVLKLMGRAIPGTKAKTWVYLNTVAAPRKMLRGMATGFYRIDHIYDVLREFNAHFEGKFSVLEFGVADGYAFTKKLYATQYLKMADRVMVHGFDTFEGLPEIDSDTDQALLAGDNWKQGTYHGRLENLRAHCTARYDNFQLHKGLFSDTLSDAVLSELLIWKPALIWIDCDLYSSTRSVFERLIPYIPTGAVIYFDDIYYNYSSRFTGEMKAVHEINSGAFGEGIELVPDRALSWDSNRLYRFINLKAKTQFELKEKRRDGLRFRGDDSPFP